MIRVMPDVQPGPAHQVKVAVERVARTRGMNPLAALAFVRATEGAEGMARVLSRLREDELLLLGASEHSRRKLSARSWIPFRLQCRLLRAIDDELGEGDLALLFEVGRYMGSHDVPRAFRPFLRLGNPGWIVEVATRLWRYYHDRGRWQLERSPVSIICTLHDHPEADVAFCQTFTGWLTGALEVSGAVDVLVDHPVCHARGANNCVFTVRWRDGAAE
jgi:predicted hydrocarbon binding protein